jgi:hypothetical protein
VPEVNEMTLRQWADSTWTKALARGAMIATPLLLAGFAGAWAIVTQGVATDLTLAKAEITEVKSTQDMRSNDAEAFQVEVRKAISGINDSIEKVGDDLFATKVDVGVIKRLVVELRDQQIEEASARLGPAVFGDTPVILAAAPRVMPTPEPFPALAR